MSLCTLVALIHSPRVICIAALVNTVFFGSIRQLFLDTAKIFPFEIVILHPTGFFTVPGIFFVKAVQTLAF